MTRKDKIREQPTGSEISNFGDNNLSLLQFRADGNNSKNCSERLRDSKK